MGDSRQGRARALKSNTLPKVPEQETAQGSKKEDSTPFGLKWVEERHFLYLSIS